MQIPLDRPSDAKVLVQGDSPAAISPDGGWIAYENNVTDRIEIHVARYPGMGNPQPISTDGGRLPIWSPSGQELYFSSLDGRQMLAVPIQLGPTLVAGRQRVLFELPMRPIVTGFRPYDLAPDGRFLIVRIDEPGAGTAKPPEIVVVQNWFEELKRRVPVK